MEKKDLLPGKRYLRSRKTIIQGVEREAIRWIKCESLTEKGAIFSRDFEADFELTEDQIKNEIKERWN